MSNKSQRITPAERAQRKVNEDVFKTLSSEGMCCNRCGKEIKGSVFKYKDPCEWLIKLMCDCSTTVARDRLRYRAIARCLAAYDAATKGSK